MIENLLYLGFILFAEYFSCVGTKEESLNYLANALFFISGLCFGLHYVAFVYLRRVINDDIDSFFIEYSMKNK